MKLRIKLAGSALLIAAVCSAGCLRVVGGLLDFDAGKITKMEAAKNVPTPMRDGANLATDVYRPAQSGKYPTVLMRLPYGSEDEMWQELAKLFVRNGIVFLAQDTRGTFDSEGVWFPFIFEADDGHDAIDWVTRQDWYDGRLGMFGGSYFGYTQLVAATDNPAITCLAPIMTSANMRHVMYRGGALEFLSIEGWMTGMKNDAYKKAGVETRVEPDFTRGFYNEPIRPAEPIGYEALIADPAELAKGPEAWIGHPGDIEHIPPMNFGDNHKTVSAPSLMIAGWYDIFLGPQMEDFVNFREQGKGDAKKTRIIVGPWSHGAFFPKGAKDPLNGIRMVASEMFDWYNYWLLDAKNGAADRAPVKIFVMGEDVWRDEQEWPLARTKYTDYYLSGGGALASRSGRLVLDKPGEEDPDHYVYDPMNPVPTAGGDFLGAGGWKPGPLPQEGIDSRADVLIYMTDPLSAPVEVTGPVSLVLYASSSARDTDWVAKLLDVDEKGKARLIRVGILRARYRNGYQQPEALEPGQVYEFTLDLWPTSNLFKKGHRIALWVTSSDFPQYDRNTNGGGEGGTSNIVKAEQAIYHDAHRPSRLILPVIPR